ncbi:MAG: hypothetical protein ACREIA_10280 [Opitutaceae bacterium]
MKIGDFGPLPQRPAGPDLFSFPSTALITTHNRQGLEDQLEILTGRTVTTRDQEELDAGCIGVAVWMSKHQLFLPSGNTFQRYPWPLPESNGPGGNPNIFGEAKAFLTLAQAQQTGCGPNTRTVIFVKYGAWKDGTPPNTIPGGEPGQIPADSVVGNVIDGVGYFNYVTLVNGKWVHVDHATEYGAQKAEISDEPPLVPPGEAAMWVRRCVPNDKEIQ